MTIAFTTKPAIRYPAIRYPAIRFGQMATGNLTPPGSGELPSSATSDKSATSLWQDLFTLTPHRKKIIWLTFLSFLALC